MQIVGELVDTGSLQPPVLTKHDDFALEGFGRVERKDGVARTAL